MKTKNTTEQDWKIEFDERFVDKKQVSEDEFDVGFKGDVQGLYDFIKSLILKEREEAYANGFMNGAEKGFNSDRKVIKLETLREVIKIVNECPPFDGCESKDWIRDEVVRAYKSITGIDIPKKR